MIPGLRFDYQHDGQIIAAAAGFTYNPLSHKTIARVTPKGKLMGGIVLAEYTGIGGSAAIHVAGFDPHWLNQNMLFAAFDYPFRQLGVKRLFGQVKASNTRALNFDLKLGFVPIHRIVGYFPDDDMILLEMLPENCRFLYLQLKGA